MKKYRKKPVVIDAIQWDGRCDTVYIIQSESKRVVSYTIDEKPTLIIQTLEGDMTANLGDWIIRGVRGEFYPCKPDIFEMTYEAVED